MRKKITCVTFFLLMTDIVSKLIIDKYLFLLESKKIINNFFYLTKVYNEGAAWSILSGKRILLILLSIVILIMLLFYQRKFKNNKRNIMAFGMIFAGLIGNMIDRIIYGYVIDFLDFNIFGYNYPVFNLADTFIVCGVFLLMVAIWKKEDENEVSSRRK